MKDLVEKIKQECATAYFAAGHYAKQLKQFTTYGCNVIESDNLHYLCCYHEDHYSRHNPFLPKDFKRLMHNKNGSRDRSLKLNQFFVLHYEPNLRAMRKKAKKKIEHYNPDFKTEEWMNNFYERFNPATVIWTFNGASALIGRRTLQQEVMNYIKSDPENVFKLFAEISSGRFNLENTRNRTKSIHIYDLLEKPKEVHFSLE